jgi:soluble lytic murein transglycosylase-like protein
LTGQAAYAPLLRVAAAKYNLDRVLVAAVVVQESSGDPSEKRMENGYYRRYIRPMNGKLDGFCPSTKPLEDEELGRSTSWGLMQLMGQKARELGFNSDNLSDLKYPSTNLEFGCKFLRQLLDLCGQDVERALLKWNGGGDPDYGKKVLKHIASGAAHRLLGENPPS